MKRIFLTTVILILFIFNSFGQSTEVMPTIENNAFNQANQKYFAKDYTAAINLYDKAIAIEPKNHLIYYNRAISKLNISDNKGACLDLKKSLELGYKSAEETLKQFCN